MTVFLLFSFIVFESQDRADSRPFPLRPQVSCIKNWVVLGSFSRSKILCSSFIFAAPLRSCLLAKIRRIASGAKLKTFQSSCLAS